MRALTVGVLYIGILLLCCHTSVNGKAYQQAKTNTPNRAQPKSKKLPIKTNPIVNRNRKKPPVRRGKNTLTSHEHRRQRQYPHQKNQFGRRIQKEKDLTPEFGKSLAGHLESFASQGKETFKSIIRSAKMLRSSAFESLLLKATWPEDEPVPKEALRQILHESIPAFEKYMELHRQDSDGEVSPPGSLDGGIGYGGCDDPYYMTNHKLYMKMIESDWRTTLKSLYIFHSIFCETSSDACIPFRQAMKQMSRKRAVKYQSDHNKYFDMVMIAQTDNTDSDDLELFIAHCTKFILHRASYFSHKYSELQDALSVLSTGTDGASVTVQHLAKSMKVFKLSQTNLELGLNCKLLKSFNDKTVAIESYRQIAKDVIDNWEQLSRLMSILVQEPSPLQSLLTENSTTTTKGKYNSIMLKNSFIALIRYYIRTSKQIPAFFATDPTMMKLYRKRMKMVSGMPSSDALRHCANSLLGATGILNDEKRNDDVNEEVEDDDDEEGEDDDEDYEKEEDVDDNDDEDDDDDDDDDDDGDDDDDDDDGDDDDEVEEDFLDDDEDDFEL